MSSDEEPFLCEAVYTQRESEDDQNDSDLSIEIEQGEGNLLCQEGEQDNLFPCTECFKDFSSLINLQRHYIKHIANKPYECEKCNKSFFTTGTLEKHIEFHKNDKLYHCEICQGSFRGKSLFETHYETHLFSEFVCNACFQCFPKKQLLQRHEKIHTSLQGDALSYDCMLCDYQFFNQRDLEDHMDEHEKINLYTCKECSKTFFYYYILERHRQKHSLQVHCNVCRETFTDKIRLHDHEQLHLNVLLDADNVLRFTCELCNAVFPLKSELENHFNESHEANARFPCTMCYKSFFFSYQCRNHKLTHMEFKTFQCNQCQNKFKSDILLSTHVRLIHGEKKIQCSLCGKIVSTRERLKIHSLVHSTYKPFVCTFCGAAFKRKPNLERHYMTHTSTKEHKCNKCDASFTRTTGLRDHMKQHLELGFQLKCCFCEESFPSKVKLYQHKRKTHRKAPTVSKDGTRSYTCNLCGKVMRLHSTYVVHCRQHTGERPYSCKYCGRTFVQRPHLLYHHKLHHSDLDLVIELPYKCAYCEHSCLKENGLKKHHARLHPSLPFKT